VKITARKLKRNTAKYVGGSRSVIAQGTGKVVRNGTPFFNSRKTMAVMN
jgi:hypothetical protein